MALYHVFLLLLTVHFVRPELRCYNCDPMSKNNCKDPESDGILGAVCESANSRTNLNRNAIHRQINRIDQNDLQPRNDGSNNFICFQLYFEADNSTESGIYRDCFEINSSIDSPCQYISESVGNGKVKECSSCTDNLCNTKKLKGGAQSLFLSTTILAINLFISICILRF